MLCPQNTEVRSTAIGRLQLAFSPPAALQALGTLDCPRLILENLTWKSNVIFI